MKPKAYKRGYPVAILIGIENDHAALWQVFSQVAKHQQTIPLNGDRKDSKAVYNFHESIVNALRPTLKEGVRSIIIAASSKNQLCTRIPQPHQSTSHLASSRSKQSNILADNRFSEHATASSCLNKNSPVQTINQRNHGCKKQKTYLKSSRNGSTKPTILCFFRWKKQKTSSFANKQKENQSQNTCCSRIIIFQAAAKKTEFTD